MRILNKLLLVFKFHLNSGGTMFPDRAVIYLSPCELPSLFSDWEDVSGVRMTKFAEQLRSQKSSKPEIVSIGSENLLCESVVMTFLDLNDITTADLDLLEFNEVIVSKRAGNFQGVCIWFDVHFPSDGDEIILSTHPQEEPTHWKQTIVPLPSNIDSVEVSSPISFKLKIHRNPDHFRRYNILLEILDAESDDSQHPFPCDCNMTKCILTKAHLACLAQGEFSSA